jgi:hypothetical protein
MQVIEPILGAVLGIIVLLDIFLLVLHARADTGVFSRLISAPIWKGFIALSQALGRWKGFFLSFAGPIILVLIIASWLLLLTLAAALIIHPNLGAAIRAIHGETPTDFVTALYVAGHHLDFVAGSDFAPHTSAMRLFHLVSSMIGVALVPLIITYLLEVYTSLRARNTLGLEVHLHSAESGDAAEVVAALGQRGRFDTGYVILSKWAADTTQVKESHHFHPILFYFRFQEPYYSVSRTSLVSLDTVTLIKCALDDNEYGWLKESAAVEQLRRSTIMELKTLISAFVSDANLDTPLHLDEQTRTRWARRYAEAVERIRKAGIKTTESGAEHYISLRAEWDRYITLLAPKFAYEMGEIDTALAKVK